MTLRPLLHMPRPCDATDKSGACPFRLDAEPGEFTADRYEKLADTAGMPGAEVPVDGPIFACHHTADGAPVACAGWLAVCGLDHLGVRMAISESRLPPRAVRRPDGVDLFDTYDDMATQQANGMYRPAAAAESRQRARHGAWFGAGVADVGGRPVEVCPLRDGEYAGIDEQGTGGA